MTSGELFCKNFSSFVFPFIFSSFLCLILIFTVLFLVKVSYSTLNNPASRSSSYQTSKTKMTPMEDHPMEESMSSIIEKMLKTHLPKLKVYFMMMREPQALKYTQTEANFKEEEVCVELKHRIKKTKRQAYHLKMAHQRLNLKDEQFEHHMEELDVYFILMEVLARIYQTPVPSTTRDEVLERLKINVEAIKLLVKSIKRYLKNLKAGAAQEHHDFGGDQGDDQDGADTSNRPFSSSRGGRGASRGGRGRGRGTRGGYSKRPHHDSDAVNPNGESSSQDFASGSVAADEQPKKRSSEWYLEKSCEHLFFLQKLKNQSFPNQFPVPELGRNHVEDL